MCPKAGAMRRDILERQAEIREWVGQHRFKAFMCRELGCRPATPEGYLKKPGLSYQGNRGGKGKTAPSRKPAIVFLHKGRLIKSHKLKLKLLSDKLKSPRCERCLGTEWTGEPVPPELHHVNGEPFDNRLENLQLLCPNCHALTNNHAGRGMRRRSDGTD